MSSISSNSKFSLFCPAELKGIESYTPQIVFRLVALIRLTYGLISNFTIHASIALPTLSSMTLISFTMLNGNCKNTRIMHKLPLSEELMNPCIQALSFHTARMELGISNPSSLATGHRRAISHTADSAPALSPAPGADPGDRAGVEPQRALR